MTAIVVGVWFQDARPIFSEISSMLLSTGNTFYYNATPLFSFNIKYNLNTTVYSVTTQS